MTRSLLVFINRKLISVDTILPLICEFKSYAKNIKIKIICPDYSTLEAINLNHFIRDLINTNGELIVLSLRNRDGKRTIKSILKAMIYLLYIIKESLLFKTSFIHFGILFKSPFKYLNIFNNNYIFFAESDSYGFTQLMQDVTFLKKNSPRIYPDLGSNKLIAFSKEWYLSKNVDNKIYYFGAPRKRRHWQDLVQLSANNYLKKELKNNNFNMESRIISIMLGYFGDLKYLSNKNSVYNCLEECIQTLSECIEDEIIVLKPHIITDLKLLNKLLSRFKKTKILISSLHPMVLATRSKFAIANYYSTTLSDFTSLGVKTIEYTEYNNKALFLTNGGSLRPDKVDFFINRDQTKLKTTINKLLKRPYSKTINYNTENTDKLFGALNGKKL